MIWLAAEWDGEEKMRRSREFGFWLLWGLWCLPLWAEVKVIGIRDPGGCADPQGSLSGAGVSAMGNQLVLSSAAQLQEAEAALAKFNQPPQSLLIEWRVDGAFSSQAGNPGTGSGQRSAGQWCGRYGLCVEAAVALNLLPP